MGGNVFDPYATAEAIRIIELKRVEAAPLPTSIWRILHHAARHLDAQLVEYFREADSATVGASTTAISGEPLPSTPGQPSPIANLPAA
jgi:hypothetical protein